MCISVADSFCCKVETEKLCKETSITINLKKKDSSKYCNVFWKRKDGNYFSNPFWESALR